MPNKIPPENAKKYSCEKCTFECSKLCDFNRHLTTAKHIRLTTANNISAIPQPKSYICRCGNIYKHASSLCKHNKTCNYNPHSLPENTIIYNVEEPNKNEVQELKTIICDLLKQNVILQQNQLEMQTTLKELIPHIGNTTNTTNNTNNTNNTNSHNTFNIQMFLDNECKNAISIQDFIQSIEINMSHLVAMSKDGYVDSISNVLINAFNDLAVTDRPLHCTDLKRETVYVRNNDTWNKSTADTSVIGKVITTVEHKHLRGIKNYIEETPESQVMDTPEHEFYHSTYWNTLGCGEDSAKLNKKIFKKILPSVKLDQQSV